jgi:hypothetical protein
MLNRRNGLLAAFLLAAICGVAALIGSASDGSDAEPSAPALTGSPVAAWSTNLGSGRIQVEGPEPSAFARPAQATDAPLAEMPELARDVHRHSVLHPGVAACRHCRPSVPVPV